MSMKSSLPRFAAAAVGLSLGCYLDDPCDEGQVFEEEVFACAPAPMDAGTSTASPDAGSMDAGQVVICASNFGSDCRSSSQCGCRSDYCVIAPLEKVGFCSATHCLSDPTLCPDGFECLNVTAVAPALESICVPK